MTGADNGLLVLGQWFRAIGRLHFLKKVFSYSNLWCGVTLEINSVFRVILLRESELENLLMLVFLVWILGVWRKGDCWVFWFFFNNFQECFGLNLLTIDDFIIVYKRLIQILLNVFLNLIDIGRGNERVEFFDSILNDAYTWNFKSLHFIQMLFMNSVSNDKFVGMWEYGGHVITLLGVFLVVDDDPRSYIFERS